MNDDTGCTRKSLEEAMETCRPEVERIRRLSGAYVAAAPMTLLLNKYGLDVRRVWLEQWAYDWLYGFLSRLCGVRPGEVDPSLRDIAEKAFEVSSSGYDGRFFLQVLEAGLTVSLAFRGGWYDADHFLGGGSICFYALRSQCVKAASFEVGDTPDGPAKLSFHEDYDDLDMR
ncbi:hypothetical protein ACFWZ3_16785 [Frateuria sp. GZRR35]|uniref:hypothetical protein n=1 Tax=Frateuria sp. GZRR35 TaxID=3351536 RepID=UPI003EDB7DCA